MGGVWRIAHVEVELVDAGWKVVRTMASNKDIKDERTINIQASGSGRNHGGERRGGGVPKDMEKGYPIREPASRLKFMNASGGSMNHYGVKEAKFATGGRGPVKSLGFQVSEVQKPLAAVWRIAATGNLVQFGPNPEDNFIQSSPE